VNEFDRLKQIVDERVEAERDALFALGDEILHEPELGFKEHATSERVQQWFKRLGLPFRAGLAVTGAKAILDTGRPGPTLCLMGELDAIVVPGHPHADPDSHAAHACGHNAQIAGLVAAAVALTDVRILSELSGRIVFFAVPAEEFVELSYRRQLIDDGVIEFIGGKPELIRLGEFDDVDLAMMIHTSAPKQGEKPVELWESLNGLIAKTVSFYGKAAHVGNPWDGINALKAATLAMDAIDAQRETFREDDGIRVHHIVTRGGDLVNVVPSEVVLEMNVRGKTAEAIRQAGSLVDRCIHSGALAFGARAVVNTLPGYLPLRNDGHLAEIVIPNVERIFGRKCVGYRGHSGSCTDTGDVSHLMPTIQPSMTGASGSGHGADWTIADPSAAYLSPGKTLAMTAIDLLGGDADQAQSILASWEAPMTKDEYLAFQRGIRSQTTFSG
jgi:amidohydrolase